MIDLMQKPGADYFQTYANSLSCLFREDQETSSHAKVEGSFILPNKNLQYL
jgi:hypothetical protein